MVEIAMRRQGARLIPVDDIAADNLVRVPSGKDVMVKITAQRNMKLFRFLWALAAKVAEACDHLHDREDAMDELKIRVRHVKYITNPETGEVRITPKSLTKLDGPGLSRLADRMIFVICRDIVPGLEAVTLKEEIMAMISGPSDQDSSQTNESPLAETKPATENGSPVVAGNPSLPDGWKATYLDCILKPADSPKSLLKRHTEALEAIGGNPTADDLAEMRALYGLRQRNLHGELTKDDFDAAVRELL